MSWSVRATVNGKTALSDIEALRNEALSQNPECDDQVTAARDAVCAIIASSTVGGEDRQYHVTMAGHANPDHMPRAGWANDTINVSVSQA